MTQVAAHPMAFLYLFADHAPDQLGEAAAADFRQTRAWPKFLIDPEIPELAVPVLYALQLRDHGLFRLPFDQVVVQYGPGSVHYNIQKSIPNRWRKLLPPPTGPREEEEFYVTFIEQKDGKLSGRSFVILPNAQAVVKNSGRCIISLNPETADTSQEDIAKIGTLMREVEFVDDSGEPAAPTEEIANFSLLAFALVGLMSADGIVQERHRAPKFINKKRAAKGKLPLFEYHTLKISPELRMPGHITAGGTHASPRLHWRRGHIRHLAPEKVTQVRPCLVGQGKLGRVEKEYLVTT